MNYIENIYICLAAPLLIAVLCMRGRGKAMNMFVLAGMTVCLLSSYINTFIAAVWGVGALTASVDIAPRPLRMLVIWQATVQPRSCIC